MTSATQLGEELGTGGLDLDRAGAADALEGDAVVARGPLAVHQLGLGDRGAEVDVPQGRGHRGGDLAARQQLEEAALGDGLGVARDRRVLEAPVDRDAQVAPDVLEDLLVEGGELDAELDEVAPRNGQLRLRGRRGGLEVGVVGERGLAAHPEVVLHAPLGRQAVVVPAHGVEDPLAAHAPVARHDVGVGVAEDVADVQRARHRGGRGVDRVDLVARGGAVEVVGPLGVPALHPGGLEAVDAGSFGDLAGRRVEGVAHGWPSLGP